MVKPGPRRLDDYVKGQIRTIVAKNSHSSTRQVIRLVRQAGIASDPSYVLRLIGELEMAGEIQHVEGKRRGALTEKRYYVPSTSLSFEKILKRSARVRMKKGVLELPYQEALKEHINFYYDPWPPELGPKEEFIRDLDSLFVENKLGIETTIFSSETDARDTVRAGFFDLLVRIVALRRNLYPSENVFAADLRHLVNETSRKLSSERRIFELVADLTPNTWKRVKRMLKQLEGRVIT